MDELKDIAVSFFVVFYVVFFVYIYIYIYIIEKKIMKRKKYLFFFLTIPQSKEEMTKTQKNTQIIHPKTLNLLSKSLDRFNTELEEIKGPSVDPYVDIKRIFKKRRNLQVAFGEAFEDRVWNSFTGEWEKNTPKMLERSKKNGETRKAEISVLYPKYDKLLKKSMKMAAAAMKTRTNKNSSVTSECCTQIFDTLFLTGIHHLDSVQQVLPISRPV